MHYVKVSALVALVVVASASMASAQDGDRTADWFDGKPRTFVANGYSTSFQWPEVLQRKLDKYFDGKRIIEVKLATQGGTPIAGWMDIKTGERLPPWNLKLQPLLSNQKGLTIVLAQQSLQWVFGDRAEGIRNADDTAKIREGARAIKLYTDLLLADGADAVVIAMHIYKTGMEPAIGNERLALEQFLTSQPENVFAGPDVWEPTRELWPQAFRADKVHPNEMGAEVMAHHWFKSLLEVCNREVPAWSAEEMRQAIARPHEQITESRRAQPGNNNLADRMKRHDKNSDGKIERSEFQGPPNIFARFDRNQDGVVDEAELKNLRSEINRPIR